MAKKKNGTNKAYSGSNWELGMDTNPTEQVDKVEQKVEEVDNRASSNLPKLGGKKSGGDSKNTGNRFDTPTTSSTTTETTEPDVNTNDPTNGYYDINDDDAEIMREIQALEAKGWNERDYDNNKRYQDLVNEMAKRHPEDDFWQTKANNANTASQMHNKFNYNSNYQDIIDSDRKRGESEKALEDDEGKPKSLRGYLPSFLMKDYGNPWWAISGKRKYYKVKDSTTGENADFWTDKAGIKKHNKRFADEQKKAGLTLSKPDENGKVNLINRDGDVIDTFSSKEAADKWLNNHFELGEIDPRKTEHFVKYNGKSYGFDTEDQAKKYRKQLNRDTRKERAAAWSELLYRMVNSIGTGVLNSASSLADEGKTYKSIQQQDMEDRAKANQAMYYKNEEAKNDNVRKLIQLADTGMIDLNNITNEQIAMIIAAAGKEKGTQLINYIGQRAIDRFLANDYAKNWSDEEKNNFRQALALGGAGPANDLMIALASGKTTYNDVAKKWKMETSLRLAKESKDLKMIDEALRANKLANRITEAQADSIRELVSEQLTAARLNNKRITQQMVTDTVGSILGVFSKIPG